MKTDSSQQNASRIARIIAAAMLLLALGSWEYSYYQLLRVVVCGVAAYSAWYFAQSEKAGWAWFFGGVAVLFNPVFIVTMQRETWQLIDVGVGIAFLSSLANDKAPK